MSATFRTPHSDLPNARCATSLLLADHRDQTVGPAVEAQPHGLQGGHHLHVRTPLSGGIGGPTRGHVELEASAHGFDLHSALTPSAARVLAMNLMAAAERVEALERSQQGESLRLILAHLAALCGHSEQLFHWVTGWLAYPLQNPGAKLNTCLQICGREGTGKSLTAALFRGLYAPSEVCTVHSPQHLGGVFNDWLLSLRFVVLEGDLARSLRPRFNELLAAKQLRIETKMKPAQVIDNQINLVLVSDELPEPHERRRMVLTCQRPEPGALEALVDAINNGGQEAFKQWLLKLDITDFADHLGLVNQAEVQPCAA